MNSQVLEELAAKTSLQIDFGGGLKSDEDVKIAFESGAKQITGGSIAAKNRTVFEGWIQQYGPDKIILGADCNNRMIATDGWIEKSGIDVMDFIISYQVLGIRNVISTDIAKDGMLEGPSFELYEDILAQSDLHLIASGGVSNIDDLRKLKQLGCSGAIVGKAIYEGKITLNELSELC